MQSHLVEAGPLAIRARALVESRRHRGGEEGGEDEQPHFSSDCDELGQRVPRRGDSLAAVLQRQDTNETQTQGEAQSAPEPTVGA